MQLPLRIASQYWLIFPGKDFVNNKAIDGWKCLEPFYLPSCFKLYLMVVSNVPMAIFVFVLGPHPALFGSYSWICTQGLFLVG